MGTKRIKRILVSRGFPRITVRLAAKTITALTRTSPRSTSAHAQPMAKLEKIAGKIVPPRQPIAKPRLVTNALTKAIDSKRGTDKVNAS